MLDFFQHSTILKLEEIELIFFQFFINTNNLLTVIFIFILFNITFYLLILHFIYINITFLYKINLQKNIMIFIVSKNPVVEINLQKKHNNFYYLQKIQFRN